MVLFCGHASSPAIAEVLDCIAFALMLYSCCIRLAWPVLYARCGFPVACAVRIQKWGDVTNTSTCEEHSFGPGCRWYMAKSCIQPFGFCLLMGATQYKVKRGPIKQKSKQRAIKLWTALLEQAALTLTKIIRCFNDYTYSGPSFIQSSFSVLSWHRRHTRISTSSHRMAATALVTVPCFSSLAEMKIETS